MDTLFQPEVTTKDIPSIPGLSYQADYVEADEERSLVRAIDHLPWDTRWQRRIQPYGSSCGLTGEAPPLPAWGQKLAQRLSAEGIGTDPFDQMLVNEYLPGQGLLCTGTTSLTAEPWRW